MLEALITSKTRIKLLLKFFLKPGSEGYLRGLSNEFGESTNSIRLELNRLEKAGLLKSSSEGLRKVFHANLSHPLFPDIQSIVRKYAGIDDIIERVIKHLGDPRDVYLLGDLAHGKDSKDIELLIVGEDIDQDYLAQLTQKAQKLIQRNILSQVLSLSDFEDKKAALAAQDILKIWTSSDQQ